MSKSKAWLSAFRLRTLPLSLSGIIAGSAVAYYSDFWDPIIFSLAMVTTVLFQILSNLANDLGDGAKGTDNDNRVGPERAVQSGIITQKEMKIAVGINSVLSLLSGCIDLFWNSKHALRNDLVLFWTCAPLRSCRHYLHSW